MTEKAITPEEHRRLIEAYSTERPLYLEYADVLERVLERAFGVSSPDAYVQVRVKTVSSFAEKCVRKFSKYNDCLRDMTDLCGARVIVQTLEQVEAVKQFVEANFKVFERDEKALSLGEERFGYRDLHFIITLDPARAGALGITNRELAAVGEKKAELQVRTWLQHAWADTLHDRIYKAPLKLSSEIRRTGNLLAALMEEGDRSYNTLAHELDGTLSNYAAFAEQSDVQREIAAQRLILANEPEPAKKPGAALRLGRLLAACGDYSAVVEVLNPHRDVQDDNRSDFLQDVGFALCKLHRAQPNSEGYVQGLDLLEEALVACESGQSAFVIHLRKRESQSARCTARLAWALEAVPGKVPRARSLYARAHEREPNNPYYLAEVLGYEIFSTKGRDLSAALRTRLLEARKVCHDHAQLGIELPRAYFTAGRVSLLLDRVDELAGKGERQRFDALGHYALGIRHCLAGKHSIPPDVLAVEREWIERLDVGELPRDRHRWVLDLLELAEKPPTDGARDATRAAHRALIVAGGAASMTPEMLERCRPLLKTALTSFAGRVVSGGTLSGVPGCVGELAEELDGRGRKDLETVGYIPKHLPNDAPKDIRYERFVVVGNSGFTPDQVLRSWKDFLADGFAPREVLCLGFGGGPLSAVDYYVALALGAQVVVALGSGGAADSLAADPLWTGTQNLLPLPMDEATFGALMAQPRNDLDEMTLLAMAREIHQRYVASSARKLPANMRPWEKLDDTFRRANLEQARHAVHILEATGFEVHHAADPEQPVIFDLSKLTDPQIDRMAEREHGRWNVERIRDGWRHGSPRDDARLIHDSLVSWADLPESIKDYDRDAVRAFPEILALAGLEVR